MCFEAYGAYMDNPTEANRARMVKRYFSSLPSISKPVLAKKPRPKPIPKHSTVSSSQCSHCGKIYLDV